MDGKAADFRIAHLHEEVLGELVKAFGKRRRWILLPTGKQGDGFMPTLASKAPVGKVRKSSNLKSAVIPSAAF